MLFRLIAMTIIVGTAMFAPALRAQDDTIPPASTVPAPTETSPATIPVVPAPNAGSPALAPTTPPLTATTPPATSTVPPLTPKALVGKSLKDLRRGGVVPAVRDDIKALRRGPLLIHGNYCGIGNRPGAPPVDALDVACMHHDACTKTGTFPTCACNDRLRKAATAIAADPTYTPELRAIAGATAAAIAVLICH